MVVLDEAEAQSNGRPRYHSAGEDVVCSESLHGHDPWDLADDIRGEEDGGEVVELGADEANAFFEAEDASVSYEAMSNAVI